MHDEKPSFRIPILVSVTAILVMLALSAVLWVMVPEHARIPLHWTIDGSPDRFGGKLEAALTTPAIALFLFGILALAPYFEPRRRHLLQSGRAFGAIWVSLAIFLTALHLGIVLIALGVDFALHSLAAALVGALFLVIGNYMGKMRSTFVLGIRTPWTLSSDRVWDRTHRLGGRLFMLAGAIAIVLALFVEGRLGLWAVLVGGIGSALIVFVYSFVAWRQEKGKTADPA